MLQPESGTADFPCNAVRPMPYDPVARPREGPTMSNRNADRVTG
jgi:hypothetical protein